MSLYKILQTLSEEGALSVQLTDLFNKPIEGANVEISFTGDPENIIEDATTNQSGISESVPLAAPPVANSMTPEIMEPYSEYNVIIRKQGYLPIAINGINIFSGVKSILPVKLTREDNATSQVSIIDPNTLYGNYPPKIPESEIKTLTNTGEIVLQKVVIPETIVVHDGVPSDSTATNYYVSFTDYIKNVACSEIYPTWPEETIKANVYAIISFTLNRVYTEWYRNKGYDFTITSSTAYDHKWIYNRNIFENVSLIVDSIFNEYIARPNLRQPILTQYCDGKKTTCQGMSQWGSKYLGDDNYTALEILRKYYGPNIYLNTAEVVDGIPMSWPGYNLDIGSSGDAVRTIQEQLVSIRGTYSLIPDLIIDGIYGENTAASVSKFQEIFNLPVTGEVDFRTWYKIPQLYVALEKISS